MTNYRGISIVVNGNVAILKDKNGKEFDRFVPENGENPLSLAMSEIDQFFHGDREEESDELEGEMPYADDWQYAELQEEYPW